MLDQDSFFVYGKVADDLDRYSETAMAIAAYSSKFKKNERVDTFFFFGAGRHYGLTLPEGSYTLLIYADKNKDQVLDYSEVVGRKEILLNSSNFPEKNNTKVNIALSNMTKVEWITEPLELPENLEEKQSLYYPSGTIRDIKDPIFDSKIATLGMYDPASFLEYAPTMFYALEEELWHKIPIVFVHGIGGSVRAFEPILKRIDRSRYKPWFFYYPSGGDLDQLSSFFYNVFLSGKVIPLGDMPMIVVAHSMGGIVVREAINHYGQNNKENKVHLLVTIASPMGGHPAAASGEKNGIIVLPAWRDLNPNSRFITELYRKPLPSFLSHQLYYSYQNSNVLKLNENNDGVVPLSSQLHPQAQKQSQLQFGFNSNHNSILEDKDMIELLMQNIANVKSNIPESHLEILDRGGFDLELSTKYNPNTQHVLRTIGQYIFALADEIIEPILPIQRQLAQSLNGEIPATTQLEKELIVFKKEYSEIIKTTVKK